MENKKCSKPPTSTYIHMYIYIYMEYVQLVNHLLTLDFLQVAHKKLLFPILKKKNIKKSPQTKAPHIPISPTRRFHLLSTAQGLPPNPWYFTQLEVETLQESSGWRYGKNVMFATHLYAKTEHILFVIYNYWYLEMMFRRKKLESSVCRAGSLRGIANSHHNRRVISRKWWD